MKKHITQIMCPISFPVVGKILNGTTERLSKKSFVVPTLLTAVLLLSLGCSKPTNPIITPEATLGDVTTNEIGVISQTTGSSGGHILDDGGAPVTIRGICWSTTTNPTIANSKTNAGSGEGIFISYATGLEAGTTYYVRAYATNSVGTAYGNQVQFTTSQVSDTTVTDIDGNVYNTITIGTQVWMLENLKTTHYQNGDEISLGLNESAWQYHNLNRFGAYAGYVNSDTNNYAVFGILYNWYAAVDPRKIAPDGWHVPTETEWTTLTNFLGGSNTAGLTLKEAGLSHWVSPNTGSTNSSGFTGLPGGYRNTNGAYDLIGNAGWWWSTTDAGGDEANALGLFTNLDEANIVTGKKGFGTSVRCIKD
jgi:uncharacterized protein (TIGR02145 family)